MIGSGAKAGSSVTLARATCSSGRPPAERRRGPQVGPRGLRDRGRGRGGGGRDRLGPAADLLVISLKLVEGVVPAGPLVADEFLEDRQRGGLGPGPVVFQGAGQPGDAVEAGPLDEEPADLQVGIGPRLQPPEDLHDEPVAEQDGRIALLQRPAEDRQGLIRRPPRRGEERGRQAPDRPRSRPDRPARPDRLQQRLAGGRLGQGVEHDRAADPGDDPPRRLLLQAVGRIPLGQPQRHEVGVGRPLAERHLDQGQAARAGEVPLARRVDEAGGGHGAGLAGEPALAEQERRDLPFEAGPGPALQQGVPARRGVSDRHRSRSPAAITCNNRNPAPS